MVVGGRLACGKIFNNSRDSLNTRNLLVHIRRIAIAPLIVVSAAHLSLSAADVRSGRKRKIQSIRYVYHIYHKTLRKPSFGKQTFFGKKEIRGKRRRRRERKKKEEEKKRKEEKRRG